MNLVQIQDVLKDVAFPGWQIIAAADGDRTYLQIRCNDGVCNVTGAALAWGGRKWMLSAHMTRTEIVQTAFKAVLTALEHEAREAFTYRGVSVFDPHLDVDRLVEFRRQVALDARSEAA